MPHLHNPASWVWSWIRDYPSLLHQNITFFKKFLFRSRESESKYVCEWSIWCTGGSGRFFLLAECESWPRMSLNKTETREDWVWGHWDPNPKFRKRTNKRNTRELRLRGARARASPEWTTMLFYLYIFYTYFLSFTDFTINTTKIGTQK